MKEMIHNTNSSHKKDIHPNYILKQDTTQDSILDTGH